MEPVTEKVQAVPATESADSGGVEARDEEGSRAMRVDPRMQADDGTATPKGRQGRSLRNFFEAYVLLILTVVAALFFSLYPPTASTFTSSANIQVMLSGNAVTAVVAFGMLVPLVCYQFDLSVGASATMGAVAFAHALQAGHGLAYALAAAVLCGLIIGLLNAVLVTRLQIDAVIATLGSGLLIAAAVNYRSGGNAMAPNLPAFLQDFNSISFLGLPAATVVWALVALLTYFVLSWTTVGRQFYMIGSNSSAARLVGIRVGILLGATFIAAAVIGSIGGVLQVLVAGGVSPTLGDAVLLQSFAASFLSVAAIQPGRFNAGGTAVSIAFLTILSSGLNLAGVPPYVHDFVNGAALLIGVGLAVQLGGSRAR